MFVRNVSTGTAPLVDDDLTLGFGYQPSTGTVVATVFSGTATTAKYADLAERYLSDSMYDPGTVVEFGGANEVTISSRSHTTRQAGVVSTAPAYEMNTQLEGELVVQVALTGRVPCRVIGTIHKGDLLVASDIPGVAMVLDMNNYQPGCIIGKALQEYDSQTVGVITVVVGKN